MVMFAYVIECISSTALKPSQRGWFGSRATFGNALQEENRSYVSACIRDAVEESIGISGMASLDMTDTSISDNLSCGVCCKL